MEYVKPELLVLTVVLYFIGMALKHSQIIRDKYIPFLLGAAGVILAGIWVVGTSKIQDMQGVAGAVFTAIVQGILVAGLSTYVNQLIKQSKKEE